MGIYFLPKNYILQHLSNIMKKNWLKPEFLLQQSVVTASETSLQFPRFPAAYNRVHTKLRFPDWSDSSADWSPAASPFHIHPQSPVKVSPTLTDTPTEAHTQCAVPVVTETLFTDCLSGSFSDSLISILVVSQAACWSPDLCLCVNKMTLLATASVSAFLSWHRIRC